MRFRLGVLNNRGKLTHEDFFPTLSRAKTQINAFKRADSEFIRSNAIFVQDTREGTEWTVDQDWQLIEM